MKGAKEAGEAKGRLDASEMAGVMEGWRERALAAERAIPEAARQMRDAAEKVARGHKPDRIVKGKKLSRYDPEEREVIQAEENGEAIAASIIATTIAALPLPKGGK